MGSVRIQSASWTLCVILAWMCAGRTDAGPQYMVAIPAVLEAGADARFCASLMHPNETLVMTVVMMSEEKNTTVLKETSGEEFHKCVDFKAPAVENEVVQKMVVEVQGPTFYSREVKKVMIKAYGPMTFIQTDKPIYLPGQTVHFRVVSMDTTFKPINQMYDIIEIEDANKNRIGQWLNETSSGKILQLSYSLHSEARQGHYEVTVSVGDRKINHRFKVEKYVLPKFDVKVKTSDEVCVVQNDFTAEVCAKYTYGQAVPGSAKVKLCRPLHHYAYSTYDSQEGTQEVPLIAPPCHTETKQVDKRGCATFTFTMSDFTKIDKKAMEDSFQLNAEVEEEGTGISQRADKRISLSYVIATLSFSDTPKIYDKGSTVNGKVKAVFYNDTPIADLPVYLFEGEKWSSRRLQNLTTDSEGTATFSLDTTDLIGDIHLHVSNKPTLDYPGYRTPYYESGDHRISMATLSSPDEKSVSSLKVMEKKAPLACEKEDDITVQYTIVGEAAGSADLIYLVLARGAIVKQGVRHVDVEDKLVTKGELAFQLKVSPAMAPKVQVVVYAVLPSATVMAHSADFSTEKCFINNVSVEFSPSSAVPGEENTMQVTALPKSLCGVSAVDQSVLIQEKGKMLNADKIFSLLPVTERSYIPYEVEDPVECLHVRPRRYVLPYPPANQDDAFTVFQNVGLKMATNLFIRVPSCLKFRGRVYHQGHGYVARVAYDSVPEVARMSTVQMTALGSVGGGRYRAPPPPIETIRTFFPETWIWDLVDVGESGKKDVAVTVPDTITTWETEAFCISPQGFGLAPRKKFTVFQPFFLELTMPYSIVRGENFELKATIFNYLSSCIMVAVTPTSSTDYSLIPLSGNEYTSCLCGSERKTLSWTMTPSVIGALNVSVRAEAVTSHASCDNEIVSVPERGRIDVVTRSLIVKAEGTEMTKTHNWLLCPEQETLKEELEIKLPENVIDGSARASVSVLGDILGRALNNLDGLLQMPYGCGEQNMALLAPNIYILQYLKNTQQLTQAIKDKASNFLTSGYQRQLNYKDDYGAYSTFGGGVGNTWLTAFVLRSFVQAQAFVFIDPKNIEASKTWLEHKQKQNGCFEKSGKLFNNKMKGGVSDEVTLSAYITAAFLEMKIPVTNPVVNRSLSCLKESVNDVSNTYTTALLAYVFTLAGDTETRTQLLQHLDKVSTQEGGFLHWSQHAADTSDSLSVEISSYVLLARLSASPTAEDLGYSTRIVRWLTGKQNYYGGFSSTQDTVVALQALALYSSLVFSSKGSSTVTVQSPSNQLTFHVDQSNKLLYQEQHVQTPPGKYTVEVKGSTCTSVQISLVYNIPTPADVNTLSVKVTPETKCSSVSQRPKVSLKLTSLYTGKEPSTNMVILDIKMLSGFVPDPESLRALRGALLVDRVEQKDDHVLVYLEGLLKDIAVNHSLDLIQELPVKNLKPAVVKIYDYYQTGDMSETEYTFPCGA